MSDQNIDVNIRAGIGQLGAGLAQARAQVEAAVGGMKTSVEGFTAVAEKLRAPFLALSAVLAGGAVFGEAIAHVNDLAQELNLLRQRTGATTEELSRLRYAAEMADVSFESVGGAMQKLARNMSEAAQGSGPAADAFHALGIRVTNADGSLRAIDTVFQEIAGHFSALQDGAAKTALAIALFGKSGAEMIPLLNQGADGIRALGEEADRLGVTMTEQTREMANQYDDAMKRLKFASEGVTTEIGAALMPALTALANAMTDVDGAGGVMRAVLDGIRNTIIATTTAFMQLGASIRWAAYALDPSNWGVGFLDRLREKSEQLMHDLKLDLIELFGTNATPDDSAPKSSAPTMHDGKKDAETAKKAAEDARTAARLKLEAERDAKLVEFAAEREHLRTIAQAKQISAEEAAAQEQALIEREYTARQLYIARVRALYQGHVRELAQIELEAARAKAEHDRDTAKTADGLLVARAARLKELLDPLRSGITNALDGLLTGKSTLFDALGKTLQQYEQQFAATVQRMAVKWLLHEQTKTAATSAGTAQRLAHEAGAAAKSVAMHAWAALKWIATESAKAIAGAYSALVGIPFVGPVLAPAAAIGAGAFVLSLGSRIASAAGGYDIPAGVNPMTQLHAREMVLPAPLADVIRGMAVSGAPANAPAPPPVVHIHSPDARGVRRLLLDNREALAEAIHAAGRDGFLTKG